MYINAPRTRHVSLHVALSPLRFYEKGPRCVFYRSGRLSSLYICKKSLLTARGPEFNSGVSSRREGALARADGLLRSCRAARSAARARAVNLGLRRPKVLER